MLAGQAAVCKHLRQPAVYATLFKQAVSLASLNDTKSGVVAHVSIVISSQLACISKDLTSKEHTARLWRADASYGDRVSEIRVTM